MLFFVGMDKSISACLLLFVFLQLACSGDAKDVSRKFLPTKGVRHAHLGSLWLLRTRHSIRKPQPMEPSTVRQPGRRSAVKSSCLVPPQPENGVRRRRNDYCGDAVGDCDIVEGVPLAPGTLLNYSCDPGYKLLGNRFVLCTEKGIWSQLPVCVDIKCDLLNSLTTTAKCFRLGRWVSCNSTMLRGTRAKLSCRPGYMRPMTLLASQSEIVGCNMAGKWEPDPIECVPVCGVAISGSTTDFPWHASIYKRFDGIKYFKCGATIVRTNLILTAASCVYEDHTNTTTDPGNLFVMSGNTFQDYDHPLHDPKTVWKSAVKNVHINCDYRGSEGYSPADIALVELQKPFEFSRTLTPACLDDSEYGQEMLQPGSYGSIAEFGATTIGGTPMANNIVSIKRVPYVPHDECRISGKPAVQQSFTTDKFCAGYPNSSTVCVNNRGGGLAFEKNDLWYVMGIVTEIPKIKFPNSEPQCMDYAIYTDVSRYTAWIHDVIFSLERYTSHPPCNREWSSVRTVPATTTPEKLANSVENRFGEIGEDSHCPAPPQPKNGTWRIHGNSCKNKTDCEVPEGAKLKPGSLLIYTCSAGCRASGRTDVYCASTGHWSMIPSCMGIECDPLNSASTLASCYDRFGAWVSCDSPVPPGTRAEVSCRVGYRIDSAFGTFKRGSVKCDENGKWTPDPITCVPVCGVTVPHQTPFAIGASLAKIGDFPWHATLYRMMKSTRGITMKFICGASIIQSKFLLTAAHCVYDEDRKTAEDPNKFFVVTGNVFQDYDSPAHNPEVVKKRAVKYIYIPCKYYGLRGHYGSDIALLELDEPFTFSGILLPTCLDVEGYTGQILEPGAHGRVAGFGRTATGESSGILQTLTLPYVSFHECRKLSNASESDVLISKDKFCAGYTNGSAVCEGDSGGGLVFKKGELWYIMGIVSVGLGVNFDNGERTCDRYSYSLHTKVSEHMVWVQDVMFQRAQRKSYPSCDAA